MEINLESLSLDIIDRFEVGLHIYQLEDLADDRTLRMIHANRAAEKFTALPIAQVIGKTLDENFPGLRALGVPQLYAEVVRTGKTIQLDDIRYGDDRVPTSWYAVKAFALPDQCMGVSFENITQRKEAELANQKLIADLQRALSEIKTLRGLIPICMDCHKIRSNEGLWTRIDRYLETHTSAELSHSICDDCLRKRYGDETDN